MIYVVLGLILFYFLRATNGLAKGIEYPSPESSEQEIVVDLRTGEVKTKIAAGAAGVGVGFAGSSALLGLSATAWTGIGAAIASTIILFNQLRSVTHLYANELVDHYENPFGQRLAEIVNQVNVDATSRYRAVQALWNQYQEVMNSLIARGGDWAIVARQSLRNLNSAEGMGGQFPEGYINRLLADLQL